MRALFFVAMSLLPSILFSQNGTLSGHVLDAKTGDPLPFCNILVHPTQTGVTSDTSGRFEISLPFGEYTVEFRYLGYETQTETISLNATQPEKRLTVKMAESAVKSEAVTVWGKYEAVSGVQSIEHKDIRRMPTVYSDVLRSIKILPGVTSNNELSSSFNVRGGNYDENLIYLNGYEIYRPGLLRQGVEENQSLINPDLVQDIRLYSGAFPARFGDKLSSALEISYGLTGNDSFQTTVRADFLNAGVAMQRRSGRLNIAAGVRYANPSAFMAKLQTTGDYAPEFFDIQTLLNYQLNASTAIEIFALHAENKFDLTPETWVGHFDGIRAREIRIEWEGFRNYDLAADLLAVKLKKKFSQNAQFSVALSHFSSDETESANLIGDIYYAPDGRRPEERSFLKNRFEMIDNFLNVRTNEVKTELDYRRNRHFFKIGIQFRQLNQENAQDELLRETSEDSAIETEQSIQSALDAGFNQLNLFAQDNIVFSEKLRANLGLRILQHNFTDETLFSPRGGLEFEVNSTNRLNLGAGVYYQPPFFHELRGKQNAGELNLKSQRAIQTNIGWKRQVNEKMEWQLDLYYKKLDKLIPYYQEELRLIYDDANKHEGFAYGLDFLFKGEIVPGVTSWLSYSYLKSREREAGAENYKRRLLDQTHTVRFFLQDKVPKIPYMQAHMNVFYGSGFLYHPMVFQDDGDGNGELVIDFDTLQKFTRYFRVDVGFTIDVNFNKNRSLLITAEVLNAWDVVNVADYRFVQIFEGTNPVRIPQVLSKRFINLGVELSL